MISPLEKMEIKIEIDKRPIGCMMRLEHLGEEMIKVAFTDDEAIELKRQLQEQYPDESPSAN